MLKKCLRAWVGSGEGTHIFSLLNLVKNLHKGIIYYLQEPLWYSSLGKIMNYSNICKFNKNRFLSNLTTVYYNLNKYNEKFAKVSGSKTIVIFRKLYQVSRNFMLRTRCDAGSASETSFLCLFLYSDPDKTKRIRITQY